MTTPTGSDSAYINSNEDVESLADEALNAMKEQEATVNKPNVYVNLRYAISQYDVNQKARKAILLWVLGLSILVWSGLVAILALVTNSHLPVIGFMFLLLVCINLYWYLRFALKQRHKYNSPKSERRFMALTLIPSIIFLVLVLVPGLILPVGLLSSFFWGLWGNIVLLGLLGAGFLLPIWAVSLEDGLIRYYLPHMKDEAKLKYVRQEYPDDEFIQQQLDVFHDLKIPDDSVKLYFDYRGDDSLNDAIRTVIYNRFEQDLFDLRKDLEEQGKPVPDELKDDLQFAEHIEDDLKVLRRRLIDFGLGESVAQLERAEKAFDLLAKYLDKPDVIPAPYLWISTFDTCGPIWKVGKYAPVKVPIKGLMTNGGARFDLTVSFLTTFDPKSIRLPWIKRNVKSFDSLDDVSAFLGNLFALATERGSRAYFTNMSFNRAIKAAYTDYRVDLVKKVVFFIGRTFGAAPQLWSIHIDTNVDPKLQQRLNQAVGDNAEMRDYIQLLAENENQLSLELLLRLRVLDKLPTYLRTVGAGIWDFRQFNQDYMLKDSNIITGELTQPKSLPEETRNDFQKSAPKNVNFHPKDIEDADFREVKPTTLDAPPPPAPDKFSTSETIILPDDDDEELEKRAKEAVENLKAADDDESDNVDDPFEGRRRKR